MRPPSEKQVTSWLSQVRPALLAAAEANCSTEAINKLVGAMFAAVAKKSKPSPPQIAAAFAGLNHLKAKCSSVKLLTANVTRLLANWHFVRDGMQVPDWDGSRAASDLVVLGVKRLETAPGQRLQYLVAAKLKTGLCAGIISCGRLSDAAIYNFLQHTSGTAKLECAAEEIAGMRARATVSFVDDMLKFHAWSCNDDQKKHNRDIAQRRVDPVKCRMAPTPCNVCNKNIRECPLAVWLPEPKGKQNGG